MQAARPPLALVVDLWLAPPTFSLVGASVALAVAASGPPDAAAAATLFVGEAGVSGSYGDGCKIWCALLPGRTMIHVPTQGQAGAAVPPGPPVYGWP